ncbi:MAG: hypothetical protein COB60_12015 [Flavobacteriaceae bacterium]|nr:MAG: hypothetical protein COB60_12015 [Flavobacteriaceae bacterium]
MSIETNYIQSIQFQFKDTKRLGTAVLKALTETELHFKYNEESSSIATIVAHISGNMLSRWTHFYSEDGEKTWRKRDAEFEISTASKVEIMDTWETGWNCLFAIIDDLSPEKLAKDIYIRSEKHTALEAINRQIFHYSYHVGQLVYIAKMIQNSTWKPLSIPKNQSDLFNELKFKK